MENHQTSLGFILLIHCFNFFQSLIILTIMKLKTALLSLGALCLTSVHATAAQSFLNAGDIVFLAANSDAPDTLAFTPLVNIAAGTVIHFSDNSRDSTATDYAAWRKNVGAFSEGPNYTWVASSAITAGTKISIPDTVHGGIAFANGGDNLFAFQGDIYNPRFISAVGWTSIAPFISTGTATANNSYLPSSLTLGTNAVSIAVNQDNAGYNGITSGTTADLRTAVNTAGNWTTSDTVVQSGPASLTISDATTAADATKQLMGYSFGPNTASYSNAATVVAGNSTLSGFDFTGTGTLDINGSNALTGQAFQVAGGWDINGIDLASQYLEFTMTIDSGFEFQLDDFGFGYQSGENITIAAFYSTDGFATSNQLGSNTSVTNTNTSAAILTDLGISGLDGIVDFRFYGFNAATGNAALEIDEVWMQGSFTTVPEPSAAILSSLGVLALLRRRKR